MKVNYLAPIWAVSTLISILGIMDTNIRMVGLGMDLLAFSALLSLIEFAKREYTIEGGKCFRD